MDPQTLTDVLLRAWSFLFILAWAIGSTWLVFVVGKDIYVRWGRWQTYPIPDKRAIKHVVALLLIVGGDLLLLWFALVWFTL